CEAASEQVAVDQITGFVERVFAANGEVQVIGRQFLPVQRAAGVSRKPFEHIGPWLALEAELYQPFLIRFDRKFAGVGRLRRHVETAGGLRVAARLRIIFGIHRGHGGVCVGPRSTWRLVPWWS